MSALVTADIESVAGPTDPALGAVVRLLATSVPDSCVGLVAYHASGYQAFLAAALAPPAPHRTLILRCVRDDDGVVAVADWRAVGETLLLNGIAVRPEERGRGLGSQLLQDGLTLARRLGRTSVALDVSEENPGAYRLYRRTGFTEQRVTVFADVPTDPSPEPEPVRLCNWPSFITDRAAYGFADLNVDTRDRQFTARLVGRVLRVPTGADTTRIGTSLAAITEASRCYAIGPDDGPGQTIARFIRMTTPVTTTSW